MQKTLIIVLLVSVVALAGVVVWQNWTKPAPVVNNQPQENGQVNSNETTSWKTYTNERYGFEVEYPTEWKNKEELSNIILFISPETQQASVVSPKNNQSTISIKIYENNLDIQEEINTVKIGTKTIDKNSIIKETNATLNGNISANQVESSYKLAESPLNTLEIYTYFKYENIGYKIHLLSFEMKDKQAEQQSRTIYNSFLSTFKFTK